MKHIPLIATLLYLVCVVICIPLAFDYEGRIDTTWTLVLIVLTLPWSLVSVLFAWALIHGAGLEFFTVLYLVFATVNAIILHRACSYFRKRTDAENT